jgi:DNA-binding response OmpR family regulator
VPRPEGRKKVKKNRVLVVDDEKNIRLTIAQSLQKLDLEVENAVNGEEALQKIRQDDFQLVLLDLKLPGMDGMEVLRKIRGFNKRVKILIITAHGTVDNAVEAMKLGAVDFIQKPFTPDEIRGFVAKALARTEGFLKRVRTDRAKAVDEVVENLIAGKQEIPREKEQDQQLDYAGCIEQAKAAVEAYDFDTAASWAQQAVSLDTSRAEAFNLLGVLLERRGNRLDAQRYYRAAVALDPTYKPAWNNLNRSTQSWPEGQVDLGGGKGTGEKSMRVSVPGKKHKTK